MKINDRLKKIGDLVSANSFCLDVGCDHALLDIYLVKQDRGINAIASDIAEGPCDAARRNIKREKLEEKIRLYEEILSSPSKLDSVIKDDLRKIIPPEKSSDFCHRLVIFGRDICKARGEKCEKCPLKELCKSYK